MPPTAKPFLGQWQQGVTGGGSFSCTSSGLTAGTLTVTDADCTSSSVVAITPTNNAGILMYKHGVSVVPAAGSFAVFTSATAADIEGATFSYFIVENQS